MTFRIPSNTPSLTNWKVRKRTQNVFIFFILLLVVYVFHEIVFELVEIVMTIVDNTENKYKISDTVLPSTKIPGVDIEILQSLKDSDSFFIPLDSLYIELVLATEDTSHSLDDSKLLDLMAVVIEKFIKRTMMSNSSSILPSLHVSTSYHRKFGLQSCCIYDKEVNDENNDHMILPKENIHGCIDTMINSLRKTFGKCTDCRHVKIIGKYYISYQIYIPTYHLVTISCSLFIIGFSGSLRTI